MLANAKTLAETLKAAGFPIVSGGTDNHLMLVDVFAKAGIGGKQAEQVLDSAGITVNKNMIPYDTRKPMDPSGHAVGHAGADHAGDDRDRRCGWWRGGLRRCCRGRPTTT